jgi:hypothetical protein
VLGDDDGDFGRFPLRGLPAPGLLFFGGRPTGLFLRFTAFLLFAMSSTSADNFTIRFEPVQTVRFGQRILKNSMCHFKSANFKARNRKSQNRVAQSHHKEFQSA